MTWYTSAHAPEKKNSTESRGNNQTGTQVSSLAGRVARGEVIYERILVGRRDVRAPANHLVDLADPAGARQPLRFDEVVLVARETRTLVERFTSFGGDKWRCGGLGGKVCGKIVEHGLAFLRCDSSAPAHHLVDRSTPSCPRQSLLGDEVCLVTAHAARCHRVASRAHRKILLG